MRDLPTNLLHAAPGGQMVQSQFMPRRLKGDCLLDIRQNRLPGAQRIQEWDFDILKQAGSEVAIGGDAQTVTLLAKMVTQWRNKTNSPLPPGEDEFLRRTFIFTSRQRAQPKGFKRCFNFRNGKISIARLGKPSPQDTWLFTGINSIKRTSQPRSMLRRARS